MRRRIAGVVTAALMVAVTAPVLVTASAPPASATSYRYWTYWHVTDSGWSFSRVGAAGYRPKDGQVEGWRFAVSTGTATAPAPRLSSAGSFDAVCGDTPASEGRKRVALVVDFGVSADAPPGSAPPGADVYGRCLSLPTSATGMDALVEAGYSIRLDDSMVCGLNGYPARGCGEVVADPPRASAKPSNPPGSGGSAGGGDAASADPADSAGSRTSAPKAPGPARSTASRSGASATREPDAASSATATPSTAASEGGIPAAETLDTAQALPTLVEGTPASATGGGSPAAALLGIAAVVAVGGGAFVVSRRRRSA